MRLPADATLIVIETQTRGTSASGGAANIAKLVEAWRAEELPIVHVRAGSQETGLDVEPRGTRSCESIIETAFTDAFAAPELEILLEEIGATTLTLCGEARAVEAAARKAADLGYQAYVVADACVEADQEAPSFARLPKGAATVVDLRQALCAAAAAKLRQRSKAQKST